MFLLQISKSSSSGEIFAESTTGNGSLIDTGMSAGVGTLIAVTVSGAVTLILLVSIILLYLKKRMCRVDGKTQPVSTNHYKSKTSYQLE